MKRLLAMLIILLLNAHLHAAESPFYLGGDISSLPELEKLGAVYRDNGKPADALNILTKHGCNLFRVRLFVNPQHDFDKNDGATQDLPMVLALCRRIKSCGAKISLAIHYSDTWADPAHQTKPAEWKDLPFDKLEHKVTDYTTSIMRAMKSNGTLPDIVEVGNETTDGMLWPDGKLSGKTENEKQTQWDRYTRLEKAGTTAVRSELPNARILIHISGGGHAGLPIWFFNHFEKYKPDYDIIGLSFYPTWNDSLPSLKKNLADLSPIGKDILIIEAAYPYKPVKQTPETTWPMTPAGQKAFLDDLIGTTKAIPDHRGIGVVWWYPEAVPIAGHKIWEGGSLGWFDQQGKLLPSMNQR
jgi:arabinogalactan endo-1,4-beta-galactosidase